MRADPQAETIAGGTAALEAALWYAQHGIVVFPIHSVRNRTCSCGKPGCEHPGKHPKTAHGFKDATKDPAQIRRWWERWPDANIGVPTGPASGLLVIDIDPRNGGDSSWDALVLKHGPTPDTAEQITGGGGRHIFFRDPGVRVPKALAPGIDVKASGGYIIVAPSIHASGQSYNWAGIAGRDALLSVPPVPNWLLSLLTAAKSSPRRPRVAADGKWSEGERNNQLTSLAGAMRHRGMSQQSVEAALLEENRLRCDPPLGESEVRRIAESIASYPPGRAPAAVGPSTPFRLTDDAVLFIDPDPEKEPLKVCGRLEVAALTRDAKSDGWGRLLRWDDPEGRAHDWAMPMSLLAGDGNEYLARLLDGGLFLAPGRKARDLLTVYLQTMRPEERVMCAARVGWHGDNFVLPDATVGPELAETVLFQTPFETDHYLTSAGSVDDWRHEVSRFCSGNSRLILAVSCAFAGPLLSLVGSESGGVHLIGPTSIGKTAALLVGGSVVGGGGRNGFVQSWRTTANGLEAVAELHNDLTLFFG